MESANDLENIGDIIETNLVTLGENLKRIYYFSKRMARAAIPPQDVAGDVLRG